MMELMQKYEKDDGSVGVDDLNRWPADSDAVEFLSAASSGTSIEALKQVSQSFSRLPFELSTSLTIA
jgi:hypothetical protein